LKLDKPIICALCKECSIVREVGIDENKAIGRINKHVTIEGTLALAASALTFPGIFFDDMSSIKP
jgi:hypothetical protein